MIAKKLRVLIPVIAKKLRVLIPLAILFLAGVGFVVHTGFGNLSAIGWESISILCPIGAIGTMLASKTIVPRAVFSIVVAVIAIIILGRAFCGWVCPVPVVSKLRTAFKKPTVNEAKLLDAASNEADASGAGAAGAGTSEADTAGTDANGKSASGKNGKNAALSTREKKLLKSSCAACPADCRPSNSRHIVLGGALLSAAIFGFPVFCFVCPIGLSFALVFVLINLFSLGDVTWSVLAIPMLLLAEVVFFRKWCSHICPVSALMSLVGKLNRSFRPTIDDNHCIEVKGGECGKCAQVCPEGIDPRHPELGAGWEECTKCRACVDVCPGKAISMPLVPRKQKSLPVSPPPAKEDVS